jgi:predicted RNA-binding Zn ribbon-like protein
MARFPATRQTSFTGLEMGSRSAFFRVGNHLALDFVNTLAAGPEGPVELLQGDADLWRWARGTELAELLGPAREPGARLDPAVPRLRGALHALFTARIEAREPPAAALRRANEALAWPGPAPRLGYSAGRLRLRGGSLATIRELLGALAGSAAELLEGAPAGRLRRCAGQGCVLLFLDVSKSGRRRWCSMAGCGNRAKAQAHYQRRSERA